MLECWNIGKMGFDLRPVKAYGAEGILSYWVNGDNRPDHRIKNGWCLFKTHYSIVLSDP